MGQSLFNSLYPSLKGSNFYDENKEFKEFLTKDILIYISEFIETLQDFLNFTLICKCNYKYLINDEYIVNNLFSRIQLNYLIKNNLTNKIKCLNLKIINQVTDLKDLNEFINLTELTIIYKHEYHLLYKFNEKCLQNLQNLKKLHITCYPKYFTGEYLINLKNLFDLKLQNIIIEEIYLQKLTQLKYLYLSDCKNFKSINFLQNLTNLISLALYNLKNVQNEDLNLQNLKSLQQITLSYLNLNNKIVKLPLNIIELNLTRTGINDLQLQSSLQNNTLQKLFIGSEYNFNGNCLQNFTNLTCLTIGDYENEMYEENYQYNFDFENLKCLNKLKELNLQLCGIQNFYENLKTLQKLNITECHSLNSESFKYLINLKYLTVFYCKNITGECLQYFKELQYLTTDIPILDKNLKNCQALQYFSLKQYNSLQGYFLKYLNNIKFIYFKKLNGQLILKENESFNEFILKSNPKNILLIGCDKEFKVYI